MRTHRARVYISLHASHLAKHERKALEEKLCSLPLSLQLPLTFAALGLSNNDDNKTKRKTILGNHKIQKDSTQQVLRIISLVLM